MSFLLDQLKKSGKKRQIELAILEQMKRSGQKQEIQSERELKIVTEASSGSSKIYQNFLYWLLGVFAISAGLFFWLKYPVVTEKQGSTMQTASSGKLGLPSGGIIKETNKPHQSSIRKDSVTTNLKEKPIKAEPGEMKRLNIINAIEDLKKSPEQRQITTLEKADVKTMSEPNNEPQKLDGIVDINKLPESVKRNLPEIKISSHLYKKTSPLVSINGRIMTEGYNITDDLYLEEITPKGVILSYRDYRFSIKAQ